MEPFLLYICDFSFSPFASLRIGYLARLSLGCTAMSLVITFRPVSALSNCVYVSLCLYLTSLHGLLVRGFYFGKRTPKQHDWVDHVEGEPSSLSGGKQYGCPMASFKFNVSCLILLGKLPNTPMRLAAVSKPPQRRGESLARFKPAKKELSVRYDGDGDLLRDVKVLIGHLHLDATVHETLFGAVGSR